MLGTPTPRARHPCRAILALGRGAALGLLGLWPVVAAAQAPPEVGAPPVEAPAPPEIPAPGPSWELEGDLLGSVFAIHQLATMSLPASDFAGNRASGTFTATHYLAPLLDDGAPWSLEPFLQRESLVYASLDGGGFVTRYPFPGNRTDANLGLGLGLDVYVTPHVALTASLGYGYDVLHDPNGDATTHDLGGSLGLGVRFGDVRIDATYTFAASNVNGTAAELRWGTAQLTVLAVLDRRFTLRPWARAIQHGGAGGVDLELFPTRELGLFLDGYGERGDLFGGGDVLGDRFGAEVGVAYWLTPSFRLTTSYAPEYDDVPAQIVDALVYGYHEVTHALSLTATLRLP